ncbi:MAG: hypothetical protein J0J01_17705 [Reyranella sp.]|uniref:hypothetical protein n=1 Tax=Reyranella sp. TaxID=1929291 RepID=UPI001AC1D35A|nr:hypothetical protein [Reyranella sp.]MBN9088743.1 hypothetical protein [Reyranella sp.]
MVTVTGENTLVFNAGTGLDISLDAAGDAMELTAQSSGNTTTLTGAGLSVRDSGTGNLTWMTGDHQIGQFSGSGAIVSSTGDRNYLILYGSQTVTVTGADTGINNLGDGSAVTLAGAGDYLGISGAGNTTTIAADGVSVTDNGGTNHFAIANGAGNDVLHIQSGDRTDVASFGSGIAYDQLWLAQSGHDLVMSVVGRPQTLTLADWFDGGANHLGEVETADGYGIGDAGVEQLVQAMAAFSAPGAGQATLPPDLAQSLAPALAANWHHA